jgi:Planctomycete cytochrome C
LILAGCVIGLWPACDFAEQPAGEGATVFRENIQPILTGKCLAYHGSDKKKGKLDLSRRATVLVGGESGPAIVPGKPADSLLLQRLSTGEMPPQNPLSQEQIAAFKKWIEAGAPYQNEPLAATRRDGLVVAAEA